MPIRTEEGVYEEQTFKANVVQHKTVIMIVVIQVIFAFLFGGFADYSQLAKPTDDSGTYMKIQSNRPYELVQNASTKTLVKIRTLEPGTRLNTSVVTPKKHENARSYPLFQDVHVMVFVGFGFLMTFLKRYMYSSVSIALLLSAFAIQWHTIFYGFFDMIGPDERFARFQIGLPEMINGEFCAAAIMISMGAVLGKLSPVQYLIMAFIEVMVYTLNQYIVYFIFYACDVGGSMSIHLLAACFGLAVSWATYNGRSINNENEGTSYYSNIFSIIGCLFLWIFWPSFNGALCETDDARMRAILNTYLSLSACALTTFAVSAMYHKHTEFDMDLIQNATLAGGVAVGSSANMMMEPVGAVIIGSVAGIVCTTGFELIQPVLTSKLKIHDTCGVNNLHGMTGLLGAIISIILAAIATESTYGDTLTSVFPGRGSQAAYTHKIVPFRNAGEQAAFQVGALLSSIILGTLGGLVTGYILGHGQLDNITERHEFFMDDVFFETTDDLAGYADIIRHAERKREATRSAINLDTLDKARALTHNDSMVEKRVPGNFFKFKF